MSLRSPLVHAVMSMRTARAPVRASGTRVNVAVLVPNPVPVQHGGSGPVPSSSEPSGSVTGATAAGATTGAAGPPTTSPVVRTWTRPAVRSPASQPTSAPSVVGVTVSGPQP